MNIKKHMKIIQVSLWGMLLLLSPGLLAIPASNVATVGSCNFTGKDICFNYSTGYTTQTASASCSNIKNGIFSSAVCSLDATVGSCDATYNNQRVQTTFLSPKYTNSTARSECDKVKGIFTASS